MGIVAPWKVTDKRVPYFESISSSVDPLHELAKHFAPHIVGLSHAKKALLLSLLSVDDAEGSRGRIHALLYGGPGSGKSTLVEAAAKEVGVEVLGSRTSPGSLTIDFRNRKTGALGAAHHVGYLVIDEFEKVERSSLKHFLRAMEEGQLSVPAGEDQGDGQGAEPIPMHWRLLATANDIGGLSDTLPELLDRFDFKLKMNPPTLQQAQHVVGGMMENFRRPRFDQQERYGFVGSFLQWAKTWTPELPEVEARFARHIGQSVLANMPAGSEVRMRSFESVMRVAFAMARVRRIDVVAELVMDAFEFLNPGWHFEEQFGTLRRHFNRLRMNQVRPKLSYRPSAVK